MMTLPDFDTMMHLHRKDPQAIERLRHQLSSELVSNSSGDKKRRLLGLQFRIDIELRRAGNPTARLLKLSRIMQESLTGLNYCLNEAIAAIVKKNKAQKADIVPLFGNSPNKPYPSKH